MKWLRHILGEVYAASTRAPVRMIMDSPRRRAGLFRSKPRDANLIHALESDHRKLLGIHQRIGRLTSEKCYTEIPAGLVALRVSFETHVLTENVRLYAFLEHLFQGDCGRLAELAEFRANTNTVLLAVLKFVKHHRRTTFDESRLLSFADEHRYVGELLAGHVTREECTLYRLYPGS
jgi:hypothetical protein